MKMSIDDVLGCICELKTMENQFLGMGRISAFHSTDNSVEIVSYDGGDMPSMRYATKVKVDVFGSKRSFLGLEGFVYISHDSLLKLYDVSIIGDSERRGFFRIKISSFAEAQEVFEQEQTAPDELTAGNEKIKKYICKVTSVSISGLLIAIDDESCNFRIGSILQINHFSVGGKEQVFSLKCRVTRIGNHEKLGRLMGCEFIDVRDKEVERLCQAIFAQQRLEIHRKRGLN